MPYDGSEGAPINHFYVGGQIETRVLMDAHLYVMWEPSSQEPRAEPEATQSVTGVVLPPGVGIAVSWCDSPCDFCFFQIVSPSSSTATMCQNQSLHQSSPRYVSRPRQPVEGSSAELFRRAHAVIYQWASRSSMCLEREH